MGGSKNKIFVTALVLGGCGYLGRHIVEAVHRDGAFASIVAASRNPSRWHIPGVTYKICDITDCTQVLELLDEVQPNVIFHTVAPHPNANYQVQYSINYLSTKQLLELARDHNAVRAFICTESAKSIASESHTRTTPLTEDIAVLHSLSSKTAPYDRTKGAADVLVREMNTPAALGHNSERFEEVLLTAVIRCLAMYGRRDSRISAPILQVSNTAATRVQLGNNTAKHEWLYFESAAHAHILAAKALLDDRPRPPNLRVDGEAFFVTDGESVKFWDFSRKLWDEAGDQSCHDMSKVTVVPMGLVVAIATVVEWVLWIFTLGRINPRLSAGELRYINHGIWWSIEKARERLGYEPICGTDEGVRRTVEWYKKNKNKRCAILLPKNCIEVYASPWIHYQ
ncbi:C-3 sterol dehydrogenase/C-4 decarboxylase-like protein [Corynespora cassiicola Philippines]|uniref:C-3 sterol dehydrogenase/C-4 decarboxylase-like protein n=1 Tax=Corynespora cassiicola Philippines TaxID=1448308 RepID=A0A2T2N2T4_CORCC|nr:C-3 sterol dehydrogenase/C-4 decarboxylase-like protein [Corynespora cassiicola Philippines]